jgi:predicted pyridoxine 5'-phosphate oxidase superfamily flavin-nucleotide-binding protein
MDDPAFLTDEEAFRERLPAPKVNVAAKKQPALEATSRAWIERAAIVGISMQRPDGGIEVVGRAAESGVAQAPDDHRVRIRDDADARIGDGRSRDAAPGSAGAIFMLPGIESTLRANGSVSGFGRDDGAGEVELAVAETYMHCPKAFIRSKLWQAPEAPLVDLSPESGSTLGPDGLRFLREAPFALLGTCGTNGDGDLSPRGDPPGFLRAVDERTLMLPDRPGNRIADSFRNVLANPVAGLLVLVPGVHWVLRISAEARPTADPEWLTPSAVDGRAPTLGLWLRVHDAVLEPAPALDRARIWDPECRLPRDALSAGKLIVDQMAPGGRFRGAKGRVVDWMLARDARRNLY